MPCLALGRVEEEKSWKRVLDKLLYRTYVRGMEWESFTTDALEQHLIADEGEIGRRRADVDSG